MSSPQEELRAKREQMLQKVEKSRLKCASPALPDAKGSAGTASSSPASPEVAASGSSQPAPTCVSPQLLDHELSEGPLSPVECTSAEASQGDELCGTQAKVPRRSDSPVLDRRCESPVMNGASNGEISGSPFNWPGGSGIPMAAGAPSATNGPTYVTINVLNSGNSLSALLSSFLKNFQANTGRPAICPPAVSEFQLQECPSPKPDKLQECPSPKPDKLQECPSPKPDTEPGDDIVDLTTPPPASPVSPDLAFMRDDTDDELDEQDPDDPDFLPVGMPKALLPPRVPQPRKVSRLSLGAPKRNCHGVLQASLERFRADGAGPSRDTVQNPSAMQQPDGLAEARNVIAAGMARMAAEIQAHAPHQPQQAQAAAVQPLYPVHQPLQDQAAALDPADEPIYPAPHLQAQAAALDPAWAPTQALQEVRQALGLPAPQAVAQGPAVP